MVLTISVIFILFFVNINSQDSNQEKSDNTETIDHVIPPIPCIKGFTINDDDFKNLYTKCPYDFKIFSCSNLDNMDIFKIVNNTKYMNYMVKDFDDIIQIFLQKIFKPILIDMIVITDSIEILNLFDVLENLVKKFIYLHKNEKIIDVLKYFISKFPGECGDSTYIDINNIKKALNNLK